MTTRRNSVEELTSEVLLAGFSDAARASLQTTGGETPTRILPRRLEPGMTVGLVAPSSHLFDPDRYRQAREVIESLGYRTRCGEDVERHHGYLAGSDDARADELNRMFADPMIDAVWCLRGGYGALRVLPHVDYAAIRANPKPFIGFSDITVLHAAIQRTTGLVTFHGPMPNSDLSPYSVAELQRVMARGEAAGVIGAPPVIERPAGQVERANRLVTITGGKARGPLAGGNLCLLTCLLGTPFEPDLAGRILFLEDIGEDTYRLDGMLSQLRLSGKLRACAGIVIGKFTQDASSSQSIRLPLETMLRELLGDLGIPVLWGLMCGHVDDQTTVPYGIEAALDADARTLTLLEPAVT